MKAAEARDVLADLEMRRAAGADVSAELVALERELADCPQEAAGAALAARVRAEMAAGPVALPAGCPGELAAALGALDALIVGPDAERALETALRTLAAAAAEARRRALLVRVFERLGELLDELDRGGTR